MDIILTRSDIDCLSSYVNQYFDREVFKETCLQLISIKIYSLIKTDASLKGKYYNRVYKLSDFCDGICLEDDERILFLEEDNAQYSYIKSINEGTHKMENVCCLYDDTYVSSSYFFYTEEEGVHSKDIVSKFLEMYGYEYRHKIEDKVRDKIFNKVIDNIKNDIQYKFLIERYFSKKSNCLNNLSQEDIINVANSFVQLEYSSIYEAILNKIESSIVLNLNRKFKEILSEYNCEMKSLNTYEHDIYASLHGFAMAILEEKLINYSSKGIFLLDKLYKIGYDILCIISKYNTIISDVEKDTFNVLGKNKCKTFKIRHNGKEYKCCGIEKGSRNGMITYGLNYNLDSILFTETKNVYRDIFPKSRVADFYEFEIIYKSKTIYKLPSDVSSSLYKYKESIFKLCDEQLKLTELILSDVY